MLLNNGSYLQFSKDGVLLDNTKSLTNQSLPLITGFSMDEVPSPGEAFKDNARFSDILKVVNACSDDLLSMIQEINIKDRNDILAYTSQGIEIRIGGVDNIDARMANRSRPSISATRNRRSSFSKATTTLTFQNTWTTKTQRTATATQLPRAAASSRTQTAQRQQAAVRILQLPAAIAAAPRQQIMARQGTTMRRMATVLVMISPAATPTATIRADTTPDMVQRPEQEPENS